MVFSLREYVYLNTIKRYCYKKLYGFVIEKESLQAIIENGDFFKFFIMIDYEGIRSKLVKELQSDNTIRESLYDEFPDCIVNIISLFLDWNGKKEEVQISNECPSYIS